MVRPDLGLRCKTHHPPADQPSVRWPCSASRASFASMTMPPCAGSAWPPTKAHKTHQKGRTETARNWQKGQAGIESRKHIPSCSCVFFQVPVVRCDCGKRWHCLQSIRALITSTPHPQKVVRPSWHPPQPHPTAEAKRRLARSPIGCV